MWDKRYRQLEKGEIVQATDEMDFCNNEWRDPADWRTVNPQSVGRAASDTLKLAHAKFRRRINREKPNEKDG